MSFQIFTAPTADPADPVDDEEEENGEMYAWQNISLSRALSVPKLPTIVKRKNRDLFLNETTGW